MMAAPLGTFDLTLIGAVKKIVFRLHSDLERPGRRPPPLFWIKPFFPRQVKVLAAAKKDLPTKTLLVPKPENLQEVNTEEIFPLFPAPLTQRPSSLPSRWQWD